MFHLHALKDRTSVFASFSSITTNIKSFIFFLRFLPDDRCVFFAELSVLESPLRKHTASIQMNGRDAFFSCRAGVGLKAPLWLSHYAAEATATPHKSQQRS